MKSGFLNNMAPNAQRALIMTLLFSGIATALFMFAVVPAQDSLKAAEAARATEEAVKERIAVSVKQSARQKKELAAIRSEIDGYREGMLEHKLGTYITHACQILYPLANGTGLKNVKVEAEPSIRRLPLPNYKQQQVPALLHVRVGVRLTAQGSFQKAVSLILQLERQQPLATLREMRITRLTNNDKEQQIDMTFEWPAASAERAPSAKPAKGGR